MNVLVRRRDVVALAAAFVVSRLVLVLVGFHFDVGIVSAAVQDVHPERRLRPGASPAVVGTAVAWLTILYVTVVGNTAEVGENFRFQFALDPLVLALWTAALCRLAKRLRPAYSAVTA